MWISKGHGTRRTRVEAGGSGEPKKRSKGIDAEMQIDAFKMESLQDMYAPSDIIR